MLYFGIMLYYFGANRLQLLCIFKMIIADFTKQCENKSLN